MVVLRLLRRLPFAVVAVGYFLWELLVANARLAWDVVTPGMPETAGIIRVPTDARTDRQILLVSSAISMTPGTLTLEVDRDRRHLFVHTLYASDPERFVQQIQTLERVLLRAVR